MKKRILIMLIIVLISTACSNKIEEQPKKQKKTEDTSIIEEEKIIDEYVDNNPIKLSFYLNNYGVFEKVTEYYDPYQHYTDIDWFNIFLTEEEKITNNGIKNTWESYYNNYENIDDYRIGYEISFTLNDGTEFSETITKPLGVYAHSFSEYVYIWVYDDINQTASWYSHLEPEQYNEKTMMTSIKLMATELTRNIKTPIYLTVFTYNDEEDFDPETGKYRGISKSTLEIKAQ